MTRHFLQAKHSNVPFCSFSVPPVVRSLTLMLSIKISPSPNKPKTNSFHSVGPTFAADSPVSNRLPGRSVRFIAGCPGSALSCRSWDPQLQARPATVRQLWPVAAVVIVDFIDRIAGGVFQDYPGIGVRQLPAVVADDGDAWVLGLQRGDVFGDDEILTRAERGAGGDSVVDRFVELPAAQVDRRVTLVIKFEPFFAVVGERLTLHGNLAGTERKVEPDIAVVVVRLMNFDRQNVIAVL